MKINKDTKISDIVDISNYEDVESISHGITEEHDLSTIVIKFKEKKQKCFDDYIKDYIELSNSTFRHYPFIYGERVRQTVLSHFKNRYYNSLPFELKIGLLAYICQQENVNYLAILNNLIPCSYPRDLASISTDKLPSDFLLSILNHGSL